MAKTAKSPGVDIKPDFSELSLPPMPPKVRAAHLRMARDPQFLAGYEPGTWVAVSGEEVVAAGPDLSQVIRAAETAGEPDPLLVPILPDEFIG